MNSLEDYFKSFKRNCFYYSKESNNYCNYYEEECHGKYKCPYFELYMLEVYSLDIRELRRNGECE